MLHKSSVRFVTTPPRQSPFPPLVPVTTPLRTQPCAHAPTPAPLRTSSHLAVQPPSPAPLVGSTCAFSASALRFAHQDVHRPAELQTILKGDYLRYLASVVRAARDG